MQIFPDSITETSRSVTQTWDDAASSYSDSDLNFEDLLNAQLDAAAREYEQRSESLLTGMRNAVENTNDTSPGPGDEAGDANASMLSLQVTQEDFAALEEELRASGLSDDVIEEMREDVASDGGMTWKELLNRVDRELRKALNGETSTTLSSDEKRELVSLFQELGFTPQQSEQLLTDITGGRQDEAWVKISNAIARMSADDSITVSMSQLAALGKAVGLPESFQSKLDSLFGGRQTLSLAPDELSMVVDLMRKDARLARHNLIQDNDSLRDALVRTMEEAQGRADMEALADNRSTRDAEASRVLIKDSAEEQFGKQRARANDQDLIGDKRTRPEKDESGWDRRARVAEKLNSEREGGAQTEHEGELGSRVAKDADNAGSDKEGSSLLVDREAKYRVGFQQKSGLDAKSDKGDADLKSAWEALTRRITMRAENVSGSFLNAQQTAEAAEAAIQGGETTQSTLSERIFKTIQDGMLRNLGQGRNQMVLRLDPPSLGKVSVILQVNNKEVTALIKTENQDVANIVSDQLEHIRQSLEAQGLKVQRLDVQTQLSQDQASHWLGAEQHNQGQEEAQDSLMSTWRRLISGGGQESQDTAAPETVIQSSGNEGLHIIA